jgi:vancomycin resistance protein YoaR
VTATGYPLDRRAGRPWKALALTAALIAFVAAAATLAATGAGVAERIPPGVEVDGVEIGGMSRDEARRLLSSHGEEAARRPVLVTGPRATLRTSGAELGARPRLEEALDEAGPRGIALWEWLAASEERELRLEFDLDQQRVRSLAARLGGAVPPADATVEVASAAVRVRPARSGRALDVSALRSTLRTLPRRVRVTAVATQPRVTTAEARTAARRVERLVGRPRTIVFGDSSRTLEPSQLRALVELTRAEHGFAIAFDAARLSRLLPAATAARNATLRIEGRRVSVVPAVPGRRLDATRTALALADPERTTIQARFTSVPPAVTTAELSGLGVRELVSEFTTHYEPGEPRVVNIQRASAVLDGTIIRRGGTFSMNAALGERTIAKGYVPAPMIAGNRFVDSVGGGISQVATTLYNAAFFAGLELVAHQPHSLYIDRYPLGREATISWRGPELVFRNDWPAAVLMKLEAAETRISVRFYSSPYGRRVETATSAPFGHGGGSFTVEYTRRVYRGRRLLRDERYRVRYGVAPGHSAPSGR